MAIAGIDHVAITAADLGVTTAFYDRLFGARIHVDYAPNGVTLVRQIGLGGAVLSVHQLGNGVDLVADKALPGTGDVCFRWVGSIESAIELLRANAVQIIDGPSPRRTADGKPSQSVYFRDPDRNLVELMAAD